MTRDKYPLDGVLLFDKPLQLSSNTALQKVRRLFQAEKAGHTGTLDPLATGLLPVCFGEATRFSNALLNADKTYRAVLRLGQTTTTGDAEGEITAELPVNVGLAEVDAVLARFRGAIQQIPPMHSALKHQGKPLYEYIRAGKTIPREPRNVVIYELLLNCFDDTQMDITVRCSKGTYVRTLAEDIGAALGCGAHLVGLRRTAIAHFNLLQGFDFQQLEAMDAAQRLACLLPTESLLPDMPGLQLTETQIKRLAQGQKLALGTALADGYVGLYGPSGFAGVGELKSGCLIPDRMLSGVAKQAAQAGAAENFGVE